ncbi:hypothetical protein CRENPOLYSF1_480001 [Crenothrix polyspora]|uniref:Uncharacterized protein n=1 Tax=Crenothrix polyspora TaxID=360316 RepID=A0A1R4HC68_9GAMM|nr:hypothetical protein CRENPOLYSF1_480001 [Crenothrix polyspora]
MLGCQTAGNPTYAAKHTGLSPNDL